MGSQRVGHDWATEQQQTQGYMTRDNTLSCFTRTTENQWPQHRATVSVSKKLPENMKERTRVRQLPPTSGNFLMEVATFFLTSQITLRECNGCCRPLLLRSAPLTTLMDTSHVRTFAVHLSIWSKCRGSPEVLRTSWRSLAQASATWKSLKDEVGEEASGEGPG